MTTDILDPAILAQFTGSETWHRHGINRKVLFTDGAKYVADAAGAYWLLDEIAIIQPYDKAVAAEDFQAWVLKVNPDGTAILTCEDGNGRPVFTKALEFTTFPEPGITLWFCEQRHLPADRALTCFRPARMCGRAGSIAAGIGAGSTTTKERRP